MERVNERKQVKCSNLPQDLSKYISVFSFLAFMQSYSVLCSSKKEQTLNFVGQTILLKIPDYMKLYNQNTRHKNKT